MGKTTEQLTPALAIHPGEILLDELDARGITQKDFSQLTGIPSTQLNEIIKGKRGVYADTAILIGKALKMDASLWTNLQMNFELDLAKQNKKNTERLESISIWQMIEGYIPVRYFKKQGIISGNPVDDIPAIKNIYQINHAEELAALHSKTQYACFRRSGTLATDKTNLIGWVKLVQHDATFCNVADFDHKSHGALIGELNSLFRKNKRVAESSVKVLANYGIKLVQRAHPEKCPVDGISFWSEGNPAIGMTMRYNRIDNFAFTLMHELGHVFLHLVNNNMAEFIDPDIEHGTTEYKNSKEEKEANEFSQNALINSSAWEEFIFRNPIFDEAAIILFANKQKIHPAIALGRFCYETNSFNIRSSISKTLG